MYSEKPLAQHSLYPECLCPREYTDSFGFMYRQRREISEDQLCYKAIQRKVPTYKRASGKWDIFTNSSWISDFTDEAEITFKMPPSVVVSIYYIMMTCSVAKDSKHSKCFIRHKIYSHFRKEKF